MMAQTMAATPTILNKGALALDVGGTQLILDYPCPDCGGVAAPTDPRLVVPICKRCSGRGRIPSAEGAALLTFFKRHLGDGK